MFGWKCGGERNYKSWTIESSECAGREVKQRLIKQFGEHSHIGDMRGRGLFLGIEIVRDCESKGAFPGPLGLNKRFKQAVFEAGLICYPMGGTIDGKNG